MKIKDPSISRLAALDVLKAVSELKLAQQGRLLGKILTRKASIVDQGHPGCYLSCINDFSTVLGRYADGRSAQIVIADICLTSPGLIYKTKQDAEMSSYFKFCATRDVCAMTPVGEASARNTAYAQMSAFARLFELMSEGQCSGKKSAAREIGDLVRRHASEHKAGGPLVQGRDFDFII